VFDRSPARFTGDGAWQAQLYRAVQSFSSLGQEQPKAGLEANGFHEACSNQHIETAVEGARTQATMRFVTSGQDASNLTMGATPAFLACSRYRAPSRKFCAMGRDIRSDLLIVWMAVGLVLARSVAASAEPGSAGGSVAGDGRSLSGPRNDEMEPPPAEGDVDSFDGAKLFAGIGCHLLPGGWTAIKQ
jgi:hypothetical protein